VGLFKDERVKRELDEEKQSMAMPPKLLEIIKRKKIIFPFAKSTNISGSAFLRMG